MAVCSTSTRSGAVVGVPHGGGLAFLGVPYAAPPVGPLRYRPPEAAPRWDGERECSQFGPACAQGWRATSAASARFQNPKMSDEDCLYLNVYTPAVDDALRPTMVWLHGGGFLAGSGSAWPYDGEAFVRDDVVLVTINYRLHALGFLYLDESFDGLAGTGNLGILDQVAALEWVRDNIAAFGGDPENVTVFGESAGGRSTAALMAVPSASGLFRRAIPQSGSGHGLYPLDEARQQTDTILARIGVRSGDLDALLDVPVDRIVEAAVAQQAAVLAGEDEWANRSMRFTAFSPVLDGVTYTDHPTRVVANGASADVDLLIGTTDDEIRMLMFGIPEERQRVLPVPDFAPLFAQVGRSVEEVFAVYGDGRHGPTTRDVEAALWGDAAFGIPALRFAEAKLVHSPRVWMYRFSWRTPVMDGRIGSCHGLELPFLFEQYDNPELLGDDPPRSLGQQMHAAWVRFARCGDPSGDGVEWPAYDLERRAVMRFNVDTRLEHDPGGDERSLWDGLIRT